MNILVTGAAGMLGLAVLRVAGGQGHVRAIGGVRRREQVEILHRNGFEACLCDVTDEGSIDSTLASRFQVVINCAGITKARAIDPIETILGNSLAPHLLARVCARYGARLIHISTDCVFSGRRGNYGEEDVPDPVDLYGRSKLLGEVAYDGYLTVRTSFIGREARTRYGLLEWFLAQTGTVPGYARALWSGLTAPALAQVLLELGRRPGVNGLLHVAGDTVDKYNLLCLLKKAFDKDDVDIEMALEPTIDRSLNADRFWRLDVKAPSLPEMIKDLTSETPWR